MVSLVNVCVLPRAGLSPSTLQRPAPLTSSRPPPTTQALDLSGLVTTTPSSHLVLALGVGRQGGREGGRSEREMR